MLHKSVDLLSFFSNSDDEVRENVLIFELLVSIETTETSIRELSALLGFLPAVQAEITRQRVDRLKLTRTWLLDSLFILRPEWKNEIKIDKR